MLGKGEAAALLGFWELGLQAQRLQASKRHTRASAKACLRSSEKGIQFLLWEGSGESASVQGLEACLRPQFPLVTVLELQEQSHRGHRSKDTGPDPHIGPPVSSVSRA